ncbi:MAG: hypothetical protein E7258_07200 [Lachnospiraceae bacterium]|nr:hypothetical protein [Lachnospiraceae bacterium]
MLGKLIRYEFVNRWKNILLIYGVLGVITVITCILGILVEDLEVRGRFIEILYGLFVFTFSGGYFVSIAGIMLMSMADYGRRMFKDQGYLTHTLPVKTIYILLARLVCDICICASMAIYYPTVLGIATKDNEIYKTIINHIKFMLNPGNTRDKIEFVLALLAMALVVLLAIWMYYAAYALGHSCAKGKKVFSVLAYIAFYFTTIYGVALLLDGGYSNSSSDTGFAICFNLLLVVYIAILILLTNLICTRRLNLE